MKGGTEFSLSVKAYHYEYHLQTIKPNVFSISHDFSKIEKPFYIQHIVPHFSTGNKTETYSLMSATRYVKLTIFFPNISSSIRKIISQFHSLNI